MPNELSYEVSLERSNQIRADLPQHPEKYTMLTGDRPTGRLHLGHYFGTLKGRVELQNMAPRPTCSSPTTRSSPTATPPSISRTTCTTWSWTTLPAASTPTNHDLRALRRARRKPAHAAVPVAGVRGRAGAQPHGQGRDGGLGPRAYRPSAHLPVHQACDILFCKGNVVPVGRDQLPHIELTRTIARRFNNRYGKVFPEVDALLSETPLLPGLDGRKMSKSYGNAINISMTAEETAKRIKKSQTDSERMITFDPENRPGVSGLLSTAAICTGRSEVEIAEEIGMGGSGQLKKYVTEAVNEYFAPIRERRQRYENDLDYVKDVLHEGNRRANEIAEQTLAEVQDAMGMVY